MFLRDAEGIPSNDFLKRGKTINCEYYAHLLDELDGKTKTPDLHCERETYFFFITMHQPTKVLWNVDPICSVSFNYFSI